MTEGNKPQHYLYKIIPDLTNYTDRSGFRLEATQPHLNGDRYAEIIFGVMGVRVTVGKVMGGVRSPDGTVFLNDYDAKKAAQLVLREQQGRQERSVGETDNLENSSDTALRGLSMLLQNILAPKTSPSVPVDYD